MAEYTFFAFGDNKTIYEIDMLLSNKNTLIIKCKDKNNTIKEYKTEETYEELKRNKLLNICENINEIRDMIQDNINNLKNKELIKIEKNNNKITLIIPFNLGIIKDIKFNLKELVSNEETGKVKDNKLYDIIDKLVK